VLFTDGGSKQGLIMSSFAEFMDEARNSFGNFLPGSNKTLTAIQSTLKTSVQGYLVPFSSNSKEQERFSKTVSDLVQDKVFLSEFSEQIGVPSEHESEDEFVKRSTEKLRQMLYEKFRINVAPRGK
jgi:hypothetical protein